MSIFAEYQYPYWGDNGRCHESKIEEFRDEEDAISDLSGTAHEYAINNEITIKRVIGADSDVILEVIRSELKLRVEAKVRQEAINKTRHNIKQLEQWLGNVDSEISRTKEALIEANRKLAELEE